jgi:hypothetical protein
VQFATSFIAKDPLTFKVSGDGKDLLSFTFTDNVCGFASSKLVDLGVVKLGANGAFSVSGLKSAPESDATEDGGKIVTTTSLSGAFVSPTKVTGTLQYGEKESYGPPSSCGPIKLILLPRQCDDRDGRRWRLQGLSSSPE